MLTLHELGAVARDAFAVLQGAIEIHYRDGDVWKPGEEEKEHPVVHRLRAAAMVSLLTDPPEPEKGGDTETEQRLREERQINARFRDFLVGLEDLCHDSGMPKTLVEGREVLAWLKGRIK